MLVRFKHGWLLHTWRGSDMKCLACCEYLSFFSFFPLFWLMLLLQSALSQRQGTTEIPRLNQAMFHRLLHVLKGHGDDRSVSGLTLKTKNKTKFSDIGFLSKLYQSLHHDNLHWVLHSPAHFVAAENFTWSWQALTHLRSDFVWLLRIIKLTWSWT